MHKIYTVYYWRDSNGNEVYFVLREGGHTHLIKANYRYTRCKVAREALTCPLSRQRRCKASPAEQRTARPFSQTT